ncbi:MAG: Bifunctional NAD(P)H-hydrate repair enzyme Nnr [Marine Group II euryarchaeote MED-G33]|nr:MAG: Bifunctional NAD(P)H-hydrate repair enzyme Nnr [Marine Group II euryarchaeote MED-G33]
MHWTEVGVFDDNAAAFGIDISNLMEAAGQGLAAQAVRMLEASDRRRGPIWILCGPGNNGGDGFAAALGLVEEGVDVRLLATHLIQRGSAAQDYRDRCSAAGIPLSIWPEVKSTIGTGHPALVIDCLIGAGPGNAGSRLRGDVASVRNWLSESRGRESPVLACDMPTGLGGQDVIKATATVTFHAEKWALRDTNGQIQPDVGEIHTANLPWSARVEDCGPGDARRHPPIRADARKGDRGRLLIVGGGPYHGAPILAGLAAERSGCDLIHVAMPSDAVERADWPLSLIPEPIGDTSHLTTLSVRAILDRVLNGRGCQAVLIGPGLGREDSSIDAVCEIIEKLVEANIPLIIDADAIRALPSHAWPNGMVGVVTPHATEMAHWLGASDPAEILQIRARRDGIDRVVEDESCVIVRTGAEDELWAPGGRHCFATGGHARMSVGGTGDLLSGCIAGLIAQGMSPWAASRLGCALLRSAGASAALEFGPGLSASDVPAHIARTLAKWTGQDTDRDA